MASIRDTLNNLARDYAVAWSSGDADAVAEFFAPECQMTINRGEPLLGRTAIADMARDLFAELPGLDLRCDMLRWAGSHALFVWTLEAQHAETGKPVVARGWEEWELDANHKVQSSLWWFDAAEYQRQVSSV